MLLSREVCTLKQFVDEFLLKLLEKSLSGGQFTPLASNASMLLKLILCSPADNSPAQHLNQNSRREMKEVVSFLRCSFGEHELQVWQSFHFKTFCLDGVGKKDAPPPNVAIVMHTLKSLLDLKHTLGASTSLPARFIEENLEEIVQEPWFACLCSANFRWLASDVPTLSFLCKYCHIMFPGELPHQTFFEQHPTEESLVSSLTSGLTRRNLFVRLVRLCWTLETAIKKFPYSSGSTVQPSYGIKPHSFSLDEVAKILGEAICLRLFAFEEPDVLLSTFLESLRSPDVGDQVLAQILKLILKWEGFGKLKLDNEHGTDFHSPPPLLLPIAASSNLVLFLFCVS